MNIQPPASNRAASSPPPGRAEQSGVALVLTLIVLVMMAIIVVAFMSSVRIDRQVSASMMETAKAEEAAEAAVAEATRLLTAATDNDSFVVFSALAEEPSQLNYYIATFDSEDEQSQIQPLYSGGVSQSASIKEFTTLPQPAQFGSVVLQSVVPTGFHDIAPEVSWHVIRDENDRIISRYAFWIEDLSGYLNAAVAGNAEGADGQHNRGDGYDPSELGLHTLFNPALGSGWDDVVGEIITARENGSLLSSETLKQVVDNPEPTSHLFVSYRSDPDEVQRIPYGLGFPEAGLPKYNLNQLIGEPNAVDVIAEVINTNIPAFGDRRRGGMPADQDYVRTIAANIIDYTSRFDNATVGETFRGVGKFPFVNAIFHRFQLFPDHLPPPSPVTEAQLVMQTFVELWNPFDRPVQGALTIRVEYEQDITFNGPNPVDSPEPFTIEVNMAPHEFLVVELGDEVVTELSSPVPVPIKHATASLNPQFIESTETRFTVWWNDEAMAGDPVDTSLGGLQRTASRMKANLGERQWKGNSAPHINLSANQFGDPRAGRYINTWRFANNYAANASLGGRPRMPSISNSDINEVRYETWPSPGHSSTEGMPPPTIAWTPDTRDGEPARRYFRNADGVLSDDFPALESNFAMLPMSPNSVYENIAELGFIFDPAQVSSFFSSTLEPDSHAGGGASLAVGRHEFPVFLSDDSSEVSANRLLDIFSVSETKDVSGRVNINTASMEVLRTLFAGLLLEKDQNVVLPEGVTELGPPSNEREADVLATAIFNGRPFYSVAEILELSNTAGPIFGNVEQWPAAQRPFLSDAGLKELFFRTSQLMGVRSRHFRIHVVGQSVQESSDGALRVTSQNAKIVSVFARPHRNLGALEDNGGETIERVEVIVDEKRLW